jgi:hypothetical protein
VKCKSKQGQVGKEVGGLAHHILSYVELSTSMTQIILFSSYSKYVIFSCNAHWSKNKIK